MVLCVCFVSLCWFDVVVLLWFVWLFCVWCWFVSVIGLAFCYSECACNCDLVCVVCVCFGLFCCVCFVIRVGAVSFVVCFVLVCCFVLLFCCCLCCCC